jgi:hypothetical protein
MKVEYSRTYYEQFVDILEDAYLAGRIIKDITMSIDEYNSIMKSLDNQTFLRSIKRKVLIGNIKSFATTDTPIKVNVTYQVLESFNQYTAKLNNVNLVIL